MTSVETRPVYIVVSEGGDEFFVPGAATRFSQEGVGQDLVVVAPEKRALARIKEGEWVYPEEDVRNLIIED